MNERRMKAQTRLQNARTDVMTLEALERTYCAHFGVLEGIEHDSFQRIKGMLDDILERAEQEALKVQRAEFCEWLHFRNVRVGDHIVSASYTKDTDGEGYYHWRARVSKPTHVAGIDFAHVTEQFDGKFRKRSSAKESAWTTMQREVKKRTPKKRTKKTAVK